MPSFLGEFVQFDHLITVPIRAIDTGIGKLLGPAEETNGRNMNPFTRHEVRLMVPHEDARHRV